MRRTFSEFKELAVQGNLIPVYEEFLADTETPVSAYLKIKDKSFSYLLESADGGKRWGRYSFIGYKPYLRVIARDRVVEIWEGNGKEWKPEISILSGICLSITILSKLSTFSCSRDGIFPNK